MTANDELHGQIAQAVHVDSRRHDLGRENSTLKDQLQELRAELTDLRARMLDLHRPAPIHALCECVSPDDVPGHESVGLASGQIGCGPPTGYFCLACTPESVVGDDPDYLQEWPCPTVQALSNLRDGSACPEPQDSEAGVGVIRVGDRLWFTSRNNAATVGVVVDVGVEDCGGRVWWVADDNNLTGDLYVFEGNRIDD